MRRGVGRVGCGVWGVVVGEWVISSVNSENSETLRSDLFYAHTHTLSQSVVFRVFRKEEKMDDD